MLLEDVKYRTLQQLNNQHNKIKMRKLLHKALVLHFSLHCNQISWLFYRIVRKCGLYMSWLHCIHIRAMLPCLDVIVTQCHFWGEAEDGTVLKILWQNVNSKWWMEADDRHPVQHLHSDPLIVAGKSGVIDYFQGRVG